MRLKLTGCLAVVAVMVVLPPGVWGAIPSAERDALLSIYNSTGGPTWTNRTNWGGAVGAECTWYGVTCDAGQTRVIGLNLRRNNLVGAMPPGLQSLPSLATVDLSYNPNLTGGLPAWLGNLTSLTSLNISSDKGLSGPIPSSLGNLVNLVTLNLGNSIYTGDMSWVPTLTKLQTLILYDNWLTGPIPPTIGNLTSLRTLDLSANSLAGGIPASLGNLVNLTQLHLEMNPLGGPIPTSLGNLVNLTYLRLAACQLTGPLPSSMGNLTKLSSLSLAGNPIGGAIPSWIGNLSQLTYLDLSRGQLTGVIPLQLTTLTKLTALYLEGNLLTGSIPSQIGSLANLQSLDLGANQLSGALPPQLGSLSALGWLHLQGNMLSGSIPTQLTSLTALTAGWLDIRWNALYSTSSTLTTFLNGKQAGGNWQSTQTIAPLSPAASSAAPTSVTLAWTPITYTADAGGYRVHVGTVPGGPYTLATTTPSKADSTTTVTGLTAGKRYYFVLDAFTSPHTNNANTVVSEKTAELSGVPGAVPGLSVSDASAPEGTGQIRFDVSLSMPWSSQITVAYATSNGSAVAGPDYTAISGPLTFPPGTMALPVVVPLVEDAVGEPDETFSLNLTNANGAPILDSRGVGTIVNDDGFPSLRVNNISFAEGNSGSSAATFTVTLSPASSSVVTVDYQTLGGTATSGIDFTAVSGTLTFNPGQTAQGIAVPVLGDTQPETNETFTLRLGGAVGAGLAGGGRGVGTITNDDTAVGPLEVLDPACAETTQCAGNYLIDRTTCGQTAFLTPDTAKLRQASVGRDGVVTDGVTLLLLRMASSVPVTFALKKADGSAPSGEEVGALMDRNACNRATTLTVSPELASGSSYVFAAYQAPLDYSTASGSVQIVATPQGSPATTRTTELRRPPVVLVHGVWSSPDTWRHVKQGLVRWTERLGNAGFDIFEDCLVDYSSDPVGSFDPTQPFGPINALISATSCTKGRLRAEENAAVTQVDVVGHSMGGLVARSRVKYGRQPYSGAWNLRKGDFRKIITIGTPHKGTEFGDLLAKDQCRSNLVLGTLASRMTDFGMPMGPAIFGFQTSSLPIAHIGATPVPAHSLVGVAPSISGLEGGLDVLLPLFNIWTTVDSLHGGENHDVIVPAESQRAGFSYPATSTFGDLTHLDETGSADIVEKVTTLLGQPTAGTSFAHFGAFQPSGTYIRPYTCPATDLAASALAVGLSLTPTAGEVYRPGEPVTVTAALTSGGSVDGLLVSLGGELDVIPGGGPWSRTFTPSATKGGRVNIVANTYGGSEIYAASTYVLVLPAGSPIQLTAGPSPLTFSVLGETIQLRVSGLYDDGGLFDLTSGAAGTTYSSANPAVATVTADGQVEARGNGSTTIDVGNGSSSTSLPVTVNITNAAPSVSPFSAVWMLPDQSVDVPISASDPDGDGLRIAGVDLPPFVTVVDRGDGTGVVQLRPSQADLGLYSVLLSVTDDGSPSLGEAKALRVQVGAETTGGFYTVTPCRLVDTRSGEGPALAAGTTRTFALTGKCGIPYTARAVSLNVTATGATSVGHLRMYPGGGALPTSSSLNFSAGQTRANNAILPLGAAGDLSVFSGQGSGSVHVVIDVNGYLQ